ncbi:MAG: CehA/McbA family metallohydrolase [Polyangiales bacterium]
MIRRAAPLTLALCVGPSCAHDGPAAPPRDASVARDATRDDRLPSLADDPTTPQGCPPSTAPRDVARALRIVCDTQRARGPLAMGRVGDVVIENSSVRFILRSGDASATTIGAPGGGVVDATAATPAAVDGLKELLPTLNYHGVAAGDLHIVRSQGDTAVVRARFTPRPLALIASVLPLTGQQPPLHGVLEYSLGAADAALRVRICAEPDEPDREVTARLGAVLLLGGAHELFTPGVGELSPESGAATGTTVLSESRDGAYGLGFDAPATFAHVGTLTLAQSTTRDAFAPGAARCVSLRFAAASHAAQAFGGLRGGPSSTEVTVPPGGRAEVYDPAGQVLLRSRAPGSVLTVRATIDPTRTRVAAEGGAFGPAGAVPPTAELLLQPTVRDEPGAPVRVTLARPDGTFVRREVVVGERRVQVPEGDYRVSASRGMEYTAATAEVRLRAGAGARFAPELLHVVDTRGYASTDLHLHTDLSTDSVHPVADAVRQMAAEGLDLVASTDHDFITDYGDLLDDETRGWIVAVPGEEVSTVRLGHYGGYPLRRDPARAGAGAVPWFGLSPAQIAAALRARGDDVVVQVNHPRLRGSGVFDQIALDAAQGRGTATAASVGLPEGTDLTPLDFDAIEVWNGYTRGDNERAFADLLALRAAGRRLVMVGNSDSHRPDLPPGAPRSFVRVPDDTRGRVAWRDVRAGLRGGDVTVGGGLFVTVESDDGARPGGRAVARGGVVGLRVRVQGAPWADCTRLRIYRGAEVVVDQPITAPADRVLRVDARIEVPVTAPGFVVVRVDGTRPAEPVFGYAPFGVTNPLDVSP